MDDKNITGVKQGCYIARKDKSGIEKKYKVVSVDSGSYEWRTKPSLLFYIYLVFSVFAVIFSTLTVALVTLLILSHPFPNENLSQMALGKVYIFFENYVS